VYTTPALEGVACWLPPGQTKFTLGRIIRSGLYATPLKMGLAAYRRFDIYMGYAEQLHARYAPPSHWYLWAIGVAPERQGQGVGSRLLQSGLARADADGTTCYLETGIERNIHFYEKHGFKLVAQGRMPRYEVPVWVMVRDAANVRL
jgi:ribosomal protein S18 acetylase RimI-like enzyme